MRSFKCFVWNDKKKRTAKRKKNTNKKEGKNEARTDGHTDKRISTKLTDWLSAWMDGWMAWPGLASLHRSSHLTWGMSKNVSRQSAGWLTDGRSVGPNDRQAVRQLVTAAGECYEATIWMWTDYKPSQSRMNWDDVAAKCCYSFGFGISSSFATLKTHTHMLRSYCVFCCCCSWIHNLLAIIIYVRKLQMSLMVISPIATLMKIIITTIIIMLCTWSLRMFKFQWELMQETILDVF